MSNKWFSVASVTALGSLVAIASAAGCSSTSDTVTQTDPTQAEQDAGKRPPQREAGATPPETPDEPEGCKDANATFTPAQTKPTAAVSSTACTDKVINALAEACLADPGAKACADARSSLANKKCAECIFTESADEEEWKVFIIDPPSFNQRGCMDHITGVKDCGRDLADLIFIPDGCLHAYCGTCSGAELDDCHQQVLRGECNEYLMSTACANAWQQSNTQLISTCFGDQTISDPAEQQKDLFVKMAKVACMGSAEPKDGG
ncbi:MAG TPA: hypothetical protein VM580_18260 [Labilithrix sp.]|nr:hypothetical protein [Labilithrix sp.]